MPHPGIGGSGSVSRTHGRDDAVTESPSLDAERIHRRSSRRERSDSLSRNGYKVQLVSGLVQQHWPICFCSSHGRDQSTQLRSIDAAHPQLLKRSAMDGVLLVDKPTGLTSFDVVARVRKRCVKKAAWDTQERSIQKRPDCL